MDPDGKRALYFDHSDWCDYDALIQMQMFETKTKSYVRFTFTSLSTRSGKADTFGILAEHLPLTFGGSTVPYSTSATLSLQVKTTEI